MQPVVLVRPLYRVFRPGETSCKLCTYTVFNGTLPLPPLVDVASSCTACVAGHPQKWLENKLLREVPGVSQKQPELVHCRCPVFLFLHPLLRKAWLMCCTSHLAGIYQYSPMRRIASFSWMDSLSYKYNT